MGGLVAARAQASRSSFPTHAPRGGGVSSSTISGGSEIHQRLEHHIRGGHERNARLWIRTVAGFTDGARTRVTRAATTTPFNSTTASSIGFFANGELSGASMCQGGQPPSCCRTGSGRSRVECQRNDCVQVQPPSVRFAPGQRFRRNVSEALTTLRTEKTAIDGLSFCPTVARSSSTVREPTPVSTSRRSIDPATRGESSKHPPTSSTTQGMERARDTCCGSRRTG